MARKASRKTLIRKLDSVCRKIVLHRDGWRCVRCGLLDYEGGRLDASHVIPKKRGYHVRWVPENIKILCKKCHLSWWHTDPFAGAWLEDLLERTDPDRLERIKTLNQEQTKSFKDNDLRELLKELEAQL